MGLLRRTLDVLVQKNAVRRSRPTGTAPGWPTGSPAGSSSSARTGTPAPRGPVVTYGPEVDGEPDPGEVVWGWVPYEDDPRQGKDRPVLLLAHHDGEWLGLMLSSQDHDRDAEDEARWGRHWMDVGTGGWDRQGRPSEVRLDRLIRLDDASIRREGAALDPKVFEMVVSEARRIHDLG
ncbi:type II toxin-antitoxin system PemK/MazF family toxin [Nocardioides solisilvae]|uniref:type II toxin-antitoxin system PemK/MazF family toxin n=1 Tax=Nocardioides solisilvae TaxID=1542435 RepID=UPI001EF5494A|nr:type II toxin-antitoxin system PemK/MazF family toxin [Nocardioides solisilvae]